MMKTKNLPSTQLRTLISVLGLCALTEGGEIGEYNLRTSGKYTHQSALDILVRKGILARRRRPFVLPVGPYAGEEIQEWTYSSATA